MNYGELLAIAVALAVDAATYAFSYGLALQQKRMSASLALALSVGGFQALMPLAGYAGGVGLLVAVKNWSGWLCMLIFLGLGISILYKTWRPGAEESDAAAVQPLGAFGLLLVGLATSMDAFAVGICLAMGRVVGQDLQAFQLGIVAGIIGFVTFIAAWCSFHLSSLLQHLPERLLQTIAGLLLIGLGVQQLF